MCCDWTIDWQMLTMLRIWYFGQERHLRWTLALSGVVNDGCYRNEEVAVQTTSSVVLWPAAEPIVSPSEVMWSFSPIVLKLWRYLREFRCVGTHSRHLVWECLLNSRLLKSDIRIVVSLTKDVWILSSFAAVNRQCCVPEKTLVHWRSVGRSHSVWFYRLRQDHPSVEVVRR